jgi:hypothetical protein
MTALAADRITRQKAGGGHRTGRRGVAAATTIYLGALIAKNAAGYVVPASDAAAVSVIGVAEEYVANAGAAGAKSVSYKTGVEIELLNAGGAITVANLGKGCYVADDQSVTTRAVSVSKVYAGVVQEFSTTKVWLFVDEAISGVLDDFAVGGTAQVPANSAVTPQALQPTVRRTYKLSFPDAATATYLYLVADKQEIIDATAIKDAAGAANTIQLTDGADAAISNAMAFAVDKTITRAGTLDVAKRILAAGATLKVVNTRAAGSSAGQLFIDAILLA